MEIFCIVFILLLMTGAVLGGIAFWKVMHNKPNMQPISVQPVNVQPVIERSRPDIIEKPRPTLIMPKAEPITQPESKPVIHKETPAESSDFLEALRREVELSKQQAISLGVSQTELEALK